MELGGLKTVPVMEAGWKGEARGQGSELREQHPRGGTEPRPPLRPACSLVPNLGDRSTHTGCREAEGVPRGPPTGGRTAAPRKQSHIEKREGRSQPRVGQGAPAQTLHFQNFWGPDLPSEARPGLSPNLREEGKPSRDRRSTYL